MKNFKTEKEIGIIHSIDQGRNQIQNIIKKIMEKNCRKKEGVLVMKIIAQKKVNKKKKIKKINTRIERVGIINIMKQMIENKEKMIKNILIIIENIEKVKIIKNS